MGKIISLYGDDYYQKRADEFFTYAMEAIAKENYEQAIDYFEQCYAFNSTNDEAYFYVGLVAYILNQFERAITIFKDLHEKYPQNNEYAYRYARGLYERQEFSQSLSLFEKIQKDSEHYIQSQFYIAKILHTEKKDAESINTLISLMSHSSSADIRFELASIYVEHNKLPAAINELKQCIEQEPTFAIAYYMLHDIYLDMRNEEQAISILKELERVCPQEKEVIQQNIMMIRKKNN
ncbi:hypothetical protein CN918_27890 [Priestia megaterium]|nr:hypothetical protein CN918_27890 [Priestia megaterium]